MSDDIMVSVTTLTDDNRKAFLHGHIQLKYVGTKCKHCGHVYDSVDDFIARNPRRSNAPPNEVESVCAECWDAFKKVKQ